MDAKKRTIAARRQAALWRRRKPAKLTRTVAALFDNAAKSGKAADYKLACQCGQSAMQFVR